MKKTVVLALLTVSTPALLFARWGGGPGNCPGYGSAVGPGFYHTGGFPMLLIFTVIVALTIFVAFRFFKPSPTGTSAVEELKLRFVRGEINAETFRDMKKELK